MTAIETFTAAVGAVYALMCVLAIAAQMMQPNGQKKNKVRNAELQAGPGVPKNRL